MSRRLRSTVLISVLAAAAISATAWLARAQQQGADASGSAPSAGPDAAVDAARFTGISRALDTDGLRLSHRWFEAGARTAWHRHVDGQLLFVEAGRARVQRRGGPLREIGVGDSDYTPPNVDHWHGAVPDEDFTQVAVGFGQETIWLEHVTDGEYHAH